MQQPSSFIKKAQKFTYDKDQIDFDQTCSQRSIELFPDAKLTKSSLLRSAPQDWFDSLNSSPVLKPKQLNFSQTTQSQDGMEQETQKCDQVSQKKILLTHSIEDFQIFRRNTSYSPQRDMSNSVISSSSFVTSSSYQPSQMEYFDQFIQQPVLPNEMVNNMNMITSQTLIDRMNFEKQNLNLKQALHIIDCRFGYEYQSGHIIGSINIQNPNQIQADLFAKYPSSQSQVTEVCTPIIVLYCEFSEKRSPAISKFIRKCDREINIAVYPYLQYPDVYVLSLGFKSFFQNHQNMCSGVYIPMKMPEFKMELSREKQQLRNWWKDVKDTNKHRSFQELPN